MKRLVHLADYGEWVYDSHGQIECVRRVHAEAIKEDFESLLSNMKHMKQLVWFGIPVYEGFPNHPSYRDYHTNLTRYGKVTAILPGDESLWVQVDFNEAGEAFLEAATKPCCVANWACRFYEPKKFAPFRLISLGFTDKPVHPVREVLSGEYFVEKAIASELNPA